MKILFIAPWTKTLFGDEKAIPGHPHLGLAYLSAVLKQNEHEVRVFDQAIENNDTKLFLLIKNFNPDAIAITAFSYCYKYVLQLIEEIRNESKVPLIIGGPHVSAVRSGVLKDSNVDFAMKLEAEESFLNFLNELKKGKPDYKNVQNLIWRKDGQIVENGDAPFIIDLDKLPFPDYSEFKFEENFFMKITLLRAK